MDRIPMQYMHDVNRIYNSMHAAIETGMDSMHPLAHQLEYKGYIQEYIPIEIGMYWGAIQANTQM